MKQLENITWKHDLMLRIGLQFFAEGSDGGSGTAGDAGGSEGTPAGGNTETNTTEQNGGKTYTQEDAAAVAKQFKMIPHNAVRPRYKSTFDKADKYDESQKYMGAVYEKYGVSPDDPAALAKAILTDQSRITAYARETGTSEDVARKHLNSEAEKAIMKADLMERVRKEEREKMKAEEAEAKETYPTFDLDKASENPYFKILVDGGVPMKAAYAMSHHAELTAAAIEAAKAEARAAALAESQSNAARPTEGATGHTAGTEAPVNYKKMSADQLRKEEQKYL
jgi:hypothetical protein